MCSELADPSLEPIADGTVGDRLACGYPPVVPVETEVHEQRPAFDQGERSRHPASPDVGNAYQLRTSGYPEREVPLAGKNRGLMVDGIRPVDGYLVEAKHVRDPDCKKKSFRSLDRLEETLTKPVKVDSQGKIAWDPVIDSMYAGDEKELVRYKQAMGNPANSEIRGLEIVTNGKDNAAYWQSMMAMSGTPGSTRYVP
ncbi:restriction endonuclease fold toxin-2 domain-containing protein [Streptomyces sp. NPDC054797]